MDAHLSKRLHDENSGLCYPLHQSVRHSDWPAFLPLSSYESEINPLKSCSEMVDHHQSLLIGIAVTNS